MSEAGPAKYKVVVLNNDQTTFEQMAAALQYVFNCTDDEALDYANTIDETGSVVMGEYIYEIAESKVADIEKLNALNDLQIQATIIDNTTDELLDQLSTKLFNDRDKQRTDLDED